MPASERRRELRRRRKRKKKVASLERRVVKASPSEKSAIAETIRRITPGAESIIERLSLEDR